MRLLIAFAVALFAHTGCAQGDNIAAGGAAGTGASGEGAGGPGPGTTTGGSPTGSTTTGPPCEEQPCKLVEPQCGCGASEQCTLDASNARACVAAGTIAWGEQCGPNSPCEPGTICVGYAADKLSCSKFCETDMDCEAPGGLCAIKLEDGMGVEIPDVTLCSANCDLLNNTGCSVSGTSCQVGVRDMTEPFTLCAPSGVGVQQAMCTTSAQCAPGFICLQTTQMENRCFQWCNTAAPNCPSLLVCQGLDIATGVPLIIGNIHYGACT